jgi:soluble cytochrome b562
MFLVPRMNRQQQKTIIEGPAKLLGGQLDPNLTTKLLNELGKVKDELPLLQHCLLRMWDFEYRFDKNGIIDLDDYQKISGIEKALSLHADEALRGMTEEELQITEKLFKALTAVDENGRKIRRPALLSQLQILTGQSEQQLLKIINKFIEDGRNFLVVAKSGENEETVIDISHESLIRQWDKLSSWVEKENESSFIYVMLAKAAELHSKGKKDYLIGSELQAALDWRKAFKPTAAWANRYREGFDKAIIYLDESNKEWTAKKNAEAKTQKRTRFLIVGLLILGLVAVGTVFTTFKFKSLNKIAVTQADSASKARARAEYARAKSDSLMGVAYAEARKAYVLLNEANLAIEMNKAILDTLQKTIENTKNAKSRETLQKVQDKIKEEKSDYDRAKTIVNGYNVVKVTFRNNKTRLSGEFHVEIKSGEWVQVINGPKSKGETKKYKEKSRNETSVFLESIDDGVTLELNIKAKKINFISYYNKSNDSKELFTIVKSEM